MRRHSRRILPRLITLTIYCLTDAISWQGVSFTEAYLRLFPTFYRYDPFYYVRMKLNGGRILDYPYLWQWLCRVYALDGVESAGSLLHCKQGYFGRSWNGVVPIGPLLPMPYPEVFLRAELASLGHLALRLCVWFFLYIFTEPKFCVWVNSRNIECFIMFIKQQVFIYLNFVRKTQRHDALHPVKPYVPRPDEGDFCHFCYWIYYFFMRWCNVDTSAELFILSAIFYWSYAG